MSSYLANWQWLFYQSINCDPSLSTAPINAWPTLINIHSQIDDVSVADLLLPNKDWNEQNITELFSTEMMSQILELPVAFANCSDQLTWGPSNSMNISTKNLYPLLDPQHSIQQTSFTWLRKLKCANIKLL